MEICDPYAPAVPARVGVIVASASPLLDGVRWAERSDIWVGPRPVTPDGRPLIGEISRGVYVAGGHGMWGLAHGPVTGEMALRAGVDWLEAGTPLIIAEGMHGVRALRERFPKTPIVADLKTRDGG